MVVHTIWILLTTKGPSQVVGKQQRNSATGDESLEARSAVSVSKGSLVQVWSAGRHHDARRPHPARWGTPWSLSKACCKWHHSPRPPAGEEEQRRASYYLVGQQGSRLHREIRAVKPCLLVCRTQNIPIYVYMHICVFIEICVHMSMCTHSICPHGLTFSYLKS